MTHYTSLILKEKEGIGQGKPMVTRLRRKPQSPDRGGMRVSSVALAKGDWSFGGLCRTGGATGSSAREAPHSVGEGKMWGAGPLNRPSQEGVSLLSDKPAAATRGLEKAAGRMTEA